MRSLQISKQITIRQSDSMNKYLMDINKFDLISVEREVTLAVLIRKGDEQALNELVNGNLRFVVSVAKQYQNQGLCLSDLINEGNLGLIKAAKRFDETRGFKFISYAVWWIRQGIIQAIAENSRIVRLPLNKIAILGKIKRSTVFFEQKYNRPPSAREISDIIDVPIKEVEVCLNNYKHSVSMDTPLSEETDLNLHDLIKTDELDPPDASLLINSLKIDLEATINSLSEREAEVIKRYYGVGGESSMTLHEIGQLFNLTRERVRQIRELAIRKLKKTERSNLLKKYL